MRLILLMAALVPFSALSYTGNGELFPGSATQHSTSYVIKDPVLTWHSHAVMRSRKFVLEGGSLSALSREQAEIYRVSPSRVYAGTSANMSLIGNYFTEFPSSPSVNIGGVFSPHVEVVSPTIIYFTFPEGLTPGVYDVELVYPGDYSVVLTRAVTVLYPPPLIKGVFPDTVHQGDEVEVEVYGENFREGITGAISGVEFTPRNVKPRSFSFSLPLLPPGYHTLTVWNPDGEFSALHSAIYVIPSEEDASSGGCGCVSAGEGTVYGNLIPFFMIFVFFALEKMKRR